MKVRKINAMENPPGDGLNFYIPWGLLEWVITALGTAGLAIAGWVWGLGVKVSRLADKVDILQSELLRLENEMSQMQSNMSKQLVEAERARAELKEQLIERLAALPTRIFIESQMQQLSGRIDGIIDAKLRRQYPHHGQED